MNNLLMLDSIVVEWKDVSYLELSEREATTSTHAAVVLDGGAADDGPQLVDGAGSDLGDLVGTRIATAELATGLWEGGSERDGFSSHVCTAGATALRGVRGDLPGRSARGHGAASPCGNLSTQSATQCTGGSDGGGPSHTVVLNLLIVLDRHVGGARSGELRWTDFCNALRCRQVQTQPLGRNAWGLGVRLSVRQRHRIKRNGPTRRC